MSEDLNIVVLCGRVTRDGEYNSEIGGGMLKVGLATNRSYKDKSGEWKKTVTYHNLTVFGRDAVYWKDKVTKGMVLTAKGSLETREYKTRDGEAKKVTEVRVESLYGSTGASREESPF